MSEKRYPVMGVCLRCNAEYFDMRSWYSRCGIDDCGGYITGKTHEELKAYRAEVAEDD